MQGPLIRSQLAQAVRRQIAAFTDADAGEAGEQEGVGKQVVGAAEFLLQALIIVGMQRPREIVWLRGGVLAANQIRRQGVTGGCQIFEQTAQENEVKYTRAIA
jgi:hypothetical protein